jgi:hypothetical protein
MSLPKDIRPDWLNVIRRLQSVGRKQAGYAVVTIQVVVNADGRPIFWNDPEVKLLEPRDKIETALIRMMAGGT